MTFFDELKRRNVFRVGIAYGVTAWIVLQVADLVFENIGAPEWMIKSLMFLVALGFIAALIIAWAYELTPEGIKREEDVSRDESVTHHTAKKLDSITLAAVILLLAFMVIDRFVLEQPPSEPIVKSLPDRTPETVPAPVQLELDSSTPGPEKSIAVLPFVDMSPEGDQAYFADGIAEEILNVLVKTHSLKVAGRTSSFQFRNREEDLRLIGEQLGVAHILEGSIRKAGDRLRITAQLVKADDGFHLWSETYDRDLVDVFAIQDEIAKAITQALAIELKLDGESSRLAPVQTTNMVAYDKYLEARNLIALRSDFPRMIQLLEEAVELDPKFAAGWATLSQAKALTIYYGSVNERLSVLSSAESYARKAIELDPSSSDAYTALANIMRDNAQWNAAWDNYQRALELNPDSIEAHAQFGQMLLRVGHLDAAHVHAMRAAELDPLSWLNQAFKGLMLWLTGNKEEAWPVMDRSLELSGNTRSIPVRFVFRMALSDNKPGVALKAVRTFSQNPDETENMSTLQFIDLIELLDKPDEAIAYLRKIDTDTVGIGPSLFWIAYFGDMELADQWMNDFLTKADRADEVDGTWMSFPALHPLYSRPVFKRLMQQNKYDAFWRVHGWPFYCRPMDDNDFECGLPQEGG